MGVGDEYDVDTVNDEQLPYDVRTVGVALPDWAKGDATFLGWLGERGEAQLQGDLGYDARDIQELAAAYAKQMHADRAFSGGFTDTATPAVDRVNPHLEELGYDPAQVMADIEEWYLKEKFLATPIAGDDYLWAVEHDTLRTVTEYCLLHENEAAVDGLAEQYFAWPVAFEQQLEETQQEAMRDTLQDIIDAFEDDSTLPGGNHGEELRDGFDSGLLGDDSDRLKQLMGPAGSGKTSTSTAEETRKLPKTYLHRFLRATEENTVEPQGHHHTPAAVTGGGTD